jgi:iron complex outermembrane recepter protein
MNLIKTTIQNKWLLTLIVLANSLGVSNVVDAAEGGATAVLMEEVMVTARRRADTEAIQDVPVSVTAFTGDQVEAMFAADLTDITANVPNATAYTSATFPGYVNFFVRGMGVAGTVISDDPAVGVFVDGVYQGISAGIVFDSFDLESVEILRGPQGTLFGRNSTGGAAILRTKAPTDEFSARVRLIAGNHGNQQVAATISGPIAEGKLLGKLAVFQTSMDDWMDNPAGNAVGADDMGEQDQQVIRGALTWMPTDTFTVDLRVEAGESESDPMPIWAVDNTLLLGVQPIPGLSEAPASDSDDPIANSANTHPLDSEWSSATIEMNWELARGQLRSITGWRDLEQEDLTQDFDGSALALFDVDNTFIEQDQVSQEIIYNVELNDRLELTAGAFYFDQEVEYGENRLGLLFAAAGGSLKTYSVIEHEVRGVYLTANVSLTDQWLLSIGGRQSWEEKDVKIGQFASSLGCMGFTGSDPRTCDFNFMDDEDWSNFTYKLNVQYLVDDDTQIYGSISRGFRSGGFNARQNAGSVPGPYDEEVVDAYEVGIKTDLADGKLRINAAIFNNQYEDLQRTVVGPDGFQTVSNAADATIQGAELELSWLIADSLLFQANFGYVDAEIEDFVNPRGGAGGAPLIVDGTKMPFVPEWQRDFSLTYDKQIGNGNLTVRAAYHYVDDVESTDDNLGYQGDDYTETDATISYAPDSGKWRVTLFGKNLSDDIKSSLITNAANPGWILNQARMPKRYGVEVLFEF